MVNQLYSMYGWDYLRVYADTFQRQVVCVRAHARMRTRTCWDGLGIDHLILAPHSLVVSHS